MTHTKKKIALAGVLLAGIALSGCSVLAPHELDPNAPSVQNAPSAPPVADSSAPQVPGVYVDSLETLEASATEYGYGCQSFQTQVQTDQYGNQSQACVLADGDLIGFTYLPSAPGNAVIEQAYESIFPGCNYVDGNSWIIVSKDPNVTDLAGPLDAENAGTF